MRANELLHNFFLKSSTFLDKRISTALFAAVETLLGGAYLTVTSLGRHLHGSAKTKHKIKRMSRLFSNTNLHAGTIHYYRKMAETLIGTQKKPLILVDWSRVSDCGAYQFLSASIPVGGRSLPLFEEAYPQKKVGQVKVHRSFLKKLETLLPEGCKPIIVTDAGFKNPWFELLKKLQWDFIGAYSK